MSATRPAVSGRPLPFPACPALVVTEQAAYDGSTRGMIVGATVPRWRRLSFYPLGALENSIAGSK